MCARRLCVHGCGRTLGCIMGCQAVGRSGESLPTPMGGQPPAPSHAAPSRTLATKVVTMSGTVSAVAPAVSITNTVLQSSMRLTPPSTAPAPTTA